MFVASLALVATACGGGGSGGGAVDVATASGPVAVNLQSDAGDYIGGGKAYQYTRANAQIDVAFANGVVQVLIQGDQYWVGNF